MIFLRGSLVTYRTYLKSDFWDRIATFISYNDTSYHFYIFWPEKAAIYLADVEAASDVPVRFDIGNAQVNCFLFGPENRKIVKGNIAADESSE